jgi:inosose dehydratase
VLACALAPERTQYAARVNASTPHLSSDGWKRLARAVQLLAQEAKGRGKRLSFHNHVGTFVETVHELDRLAASTDPALVGICLDVGHYALAGGDPTAALRTFGSRVDHVHLKDVSADVRQGMRYGSVPGFIAGLRARVFTELGTGVLDLERVLRLLAVRGYRGWLMVEQDTTWRRPAESAAISHAMLIRTLAQLKGEVQ